MSDVKKIVIKSKLELCDGAIHKSKFILKENFISYEECIDNPNCSMFVADLYEKYAYRAQSEVFKSNFKDICNEIIRCAEHNYLSGENYEKYDVKIYLNNECIISFSFYDTLETEELKELARLIKCTIPPCECYPEWLEANELYLDEQTLEYIEKIKKGEI